MSLDEALGEHNDDEPFFTNWKVIFKQNTLDIAKTCLDSLVAPIVNTEDPRIGVITYAYSQTVQHQNDRMQQNCVYFTELFHDLDTFQTHLTEAEAEPVVELFQCIEGRIVGHVNSPTWHEGIKATIVMNQVHPARTTCGHVLNPYPKSLLGGKYGRRILAEEGKAVMFELRVHPTTKDVSDRLMSLLKPLTTFTKSDMSRVSSYVVRGPGWWRRTPTTTSKTIHLKTTDAKIPTSSYTEEFGTDNTIEFRMILSHCIGCRHQFPREMVTELAQLLQDSSSVMASEFIVTAEDWEEETLVDLLEYFDDNHLLTSDRRNLLSGYLIHPYYLKNWKGKEMGKMEKGKMEKGKMEKKKGAQKEEKKSVKVKNSNVKSLLLVQILFFFFILTEL